MERRSSENKALRELVDALKEYITVRDSLWTLGFFDRIFRFSRCVAMLNRYDTARERVRAAIRDVKETAEAAVLENQARPEAGEDAFAEKTPALAARSLVSMEEFEMLLGKPAILKKRSPQREPQRGSGVRPAGLPPPPRKETDPAR
ncbi:hypothetical protein KL86DPRO_50150 [uncultured delta proteobacterium]|uniref:Uncharacterized protein n=1 Tax=uncultured delta proteobacterium TaxID=34034 RepID=A0A212KCI0_9DELT|nr:hypothetical protein KL86DPRO_50150 [uncultured delta proteobacterium]